MKEWKCFRRTCLEFRKTQALPELLDVVWQVQVIIPSQALFRYVLLECCRLSWFLEEWPCLSQWDSLKRNIPQEKALSLVGLFLLSFTLDLLDVLKCASIYSNKTIWVYEHWSLWSFPINLWSSCWSPVAGYLWEPPESRANDYHKGTGSEFKGNLFSLSFLGNVPQEWYSLYSTQRKLRRWQSELKEKVVLL